MIDACPKEQATRRLYKIKINIARKISLQEKIILQGHKRKPFVFICQTHWTHRL